MKKLLTIAFIVSTFILNAQIPFDQIPSFETDALGHYSTGLGIADINGDGWKDIIVANGNDMARQGLLVYYNRGDGTFPLIADWQSNDIDYHGHLAAGDIDNDGDVDIAVSVYLGAGGFGNTGKAKIYYNTGSSLEGTPSYQSENFYTFSCAFGDADADGDLDLAVACGEPYNSIYDHGRIFYNNNGSFSASADWESNIVMGALDVEFGDVDGNGFLDLIYVCQNIDNYIFLADDHGHIDEDFDWVSDHPLNFMNSVDFGKPCATSGRCIVTTGNDQLGGDGKIKQFTFSGSIPASSAPSWESDYVGYGSGILMAEITNDDNLDLLYGSWWGPLSILEGDCGFWDPNPVFQAEASSVVEAILMSDLGMFNYQTTNRTIKALIEESVIYLDQQIIESINAIYVNGVLLNKDEYCYVELKNWVSFKENIMPGDVVSIDYVPMINGDIVISNWDASKGNYIYYNHNNPVGMAENEQLFTHQIVRNISPQPASDHVNIRFHNADQKLIKIKLYDMRGKIMDSRTISCAENYRFNISHLPTGVYSLQVSDAKHSEQIKLIKVN